MIPDEDPLEEYRTLGDEKPKPIKWTRETGELSVHLPRRNQRTTKSLEETYNSGGYQYGRRPKGWRP